MGIWWLIGSVCDGLVGIDRLQDSLVVNQGLQMCQPPPDSLVSSNIPPELIRMLANIVYIKNQWQILNSIRHIFGKVLLFAILRRIKINPGGVGKPALFFSPSNYLLRKILQLQMASSGGIDLFCFKKN